MRLVDLSRPLENDVPADPPGLGPRIEYFDHTQSLPGMLAMFPGLEANQLPGGEAWAVERLTISTHNGTHVDAPWHYASTMNRGERAWTIDEAPLDWFYRPGLKLDFRDAPDGHVVTAAEMAQRVASTGHELKPLDIVLMNTGAGSAYGTPAYVDSGCGFGRDATLWLLERGVRVVGTDAGAGMLRSHLRAAGFSLPAIPRSFGKATKPASRSDTAISRNWPIWSFCPHPDFWCAASRSRSRARPPASREL